MELIEKAKERISTSDLSLSKIAYKLGFEHLQSFSWLVIAKTQLPSGVKVIMPLNSSSGSLIKSSPELQRALIGFAFE
ncbi:hypothetical protein GA0116948_10319 [Chitinophaga costaii]|uniref:Uncharacterized protein n=1 Tax=Chitinophaga costaii TaxID=1335309 RepID=A0A1C4BBA3_9BACT|nr:hypothetical protein GA0116948_10319 [Chitinophaga costaii]